MNTETLRLERDQIYRDIYDGKKPKRIPIEFIITWDAAIPYCGMNLKEAQWDYRSCEVFFNKISAEFDTDKFSLPGIPRIPMFYQMGESKAIQMSDSGTMQHPEVHCLEPNEYDFFIEDPYKCMVDLLIPRLYPALDLKTAQGSLNFGKTYVAKMDINKNISNAIAKVSQKYGFSTCGRAGMTEAPFDFLADFIRSFSGIVGDLRREGDKVEAACEAVLPHLLKIATTPASSRYMRTFIPLHMAPFLREKDFVRFWWPTFKKMMDALEEKGVGVTLFVEQDWTRYLDYLKELEGRVELIFEYGEPQKIQEKIGGKHIVSGLFPITMLQTATKQECMDKAKELIDIFGPEGNYIFNTDKAIYSLNGNIAENLKAVIETVKTYGRY